MNHKAIAQFTLEDGTEVLFEVPEPDDGNALQEVTNIGQTVYEVADGAAGTFERTLDKVKPVANAVLSRLGAGLSTPANEVEVKFGLKLTADAGVIFSSVGGEVSFEVTLKWQKD